MPFVSDNILKIFELWKTVYAFLDRHRQVFARYPKLNNEWGFKFVKCGVHFCELMKSGVLCQRKFWVALMRCDGTLSLHNWIGCQWPLRSSKINDFHLIWKGICHYLLVISPNSNLGPIPLAVFEMRPLYIAWYFLLKTAAKLLQIETWSLLTASEVASALSDAPTPYYLPFRDNTFVTERQTDDIPSPYYKLDRYVSTVG